MLNPVVSSTDRTVGGFSLPGPRGGCAACRRRTARRARRYDQGPPRASGSTPRILLALGIVDEATFRIYAGLYGYDKTALESRVESVADADRWRIERVGFAAAYRGERMSALIYTPKNVPPPWQVVIYFPGSGALHARSSADLSTGVFSYVLKSGRALVYPIYKSTYERGDGLASDNQDPTRNYRDHVLMWAQGSLPRSRLCGDAEGPRQSSPCLPRRKLGRSVRSAAGRP